MKSKKKCVVYTAIAGDFDSLKENQAKSDCDYIAFTDKPVKSKTWQIRNINDYLPPIYQRLDNNRRAKWFKLFPNRLFPDYEYSLWIDGSIETLTPIEQLISRYMSNKEHWAVHKHASRTCIVDEAFACASLKKDSPDVMSKQLAKYFVRYNYPKNNGLAENTVILRKHGSKKVINLANEWWNEIIEHSRRDQLSFNFVAWKQKFKYREMDDTLYTSSDFLLYPHN